MGNSSKLLPSRLQIADHYRSHYGVVAEDGVSLDDLLRPEYWAHVATKLRKFDIIEVLPEDGSFFVELIVLQVGIGYAKVMLLREVGLEADEVLPDADGVIVKWKGPHRKWAVIRTTDGQILRDGHEDKAAAALWAQGYAQTIAA